MNKINFTHTHTHTHTYTHAHACICLQVHVPLLHHTLLTLYMAHALRVEEEVHI